MLCALTIHLTLLKERLQLNTKRRIIKMIRGGKERNNEGKYRIDR